MRSTDLLQETLGGLVESLGEVLHPQMLEGVLYRIGAKLGERSSQRHLLMRRRTAALSIRDCAETAVASGWWPCMAGGVTSKGLSIDILECPFGEKAADNPRICQFTKGYFEVIAHDQLGAADVTVQRGEGRPPRHCAVTIELRADGSRRGNVSGVAETSDKLAGKIEASEIRTRMSSLEVRVLELIGQGLTDKEIGATLSLSVRTIENYVARIREKLGLRRRAHLIRFAIRHRLSDL